MTEKTYEDGVLDGLAHAATVIGHVHDFHRTHNAHQISVHDWAIAHWAWDQAISGIRQLEVATQLNGVLQKLLEDDK